MTITVPTIGQDPWGVDLNNVLLSLQAQIGDIVSVTDEPFAAVGDDSTDDTAAIQAAIDAAYTDSATAPLGKTVFLPPGSYRISAPLVLHPYVTLRGSYAMRGTNIQLSRIKPLGSFVGTAIISMVDAATGGYLTVSEGQRLIDITLDGSVLPGTTSGIVGTGHVHGVGMKNVSVDQVTDRGIQTLTNGSGHPFSWNLENVQVSTATLDGFRMSGTTDTTLIGCRAIGCGRRGYYIDGMANSTFTACRSEFSGERGWYITSGWGTGTGSGGAVFEGCTTDRSEQDGFYIDATGSPTLVFTGLIARRDGRNGNVGGGNFSGFRVSAATTPVQVDGLTVYPGVDDDGSGTNSPQIGFVASGSTWVSLSSGYLHANTTSFSDGGTNTFLQRGLGVGLATGTTAAPVRALAEPANAAGSLTLTQGGYVATRGAVGNTAFEADITGDTVSRINIAAGGDVTWGPGGGVARDVGPLNRSGAGVLSLTSTDFRIATIGRGLRVAEGANAKQGVATLVGGTVTVANTSVTANSRIFITVQSLGTVAVASGYAVTARTAGVSFTITASVGTDTSVIAWQMLEPA